MNLNEAAGPEPLIKEFFDRVLVEYNEHKTRMSGNQDGGKDHYAFYLVF